MRFLEEESLKMSASFLGLVKDPALLENVTTERPDPTHEPVIIGRYDVTPPGGKESIDNDKWIWCSHCQKLNHWKAMSLKVEITAT